MIKKILLVIVGMLGLLFLAAWMFIPINGPLLDFMTGKQIEPPKSAQLGSAFTLPEGFQVSIFAQDVPHARMMRMTDQTDILVTSMRQGNVILLHGDRDNDGNSDGRTILLSGLDVPHGLDLFGGYLYVAETGRISRWPFDSQNRSIGDQEIIFDDIPPGGNHRTRTIGFGPDGWLYLSIGSTCNVCEEESPYRATIMRIRADGSDAEIFARGLRNSVGFDWHPHSKRMYATDNGRDLLGDDTPHCEVNEIIEGAHYGWPYAYNDREADPDYGAGHGDIINTSKIPVHSLGAHRAPLGMRFISAINMAAEYEGMALVAEHGSWNSSVLVGYKVVGLRFNEDGSVTESDFMTGFERDGQVIGRPVDIVQDKSGVIYISDDYAGVIYRVAHKDNPSAQFDNAVLDQQSARADLSGVDVAALYPVGQRLFDENGCAVCHVQSEETVGVAVKPLVDLKSRYDIDGILGVLRVPPGPMPKADLTAPEEQALAVYLLSLDP